MDLREIGWGGMDWINLAQNRDQWWALVKTVINRRGPKNVGNILSGWATGGFSKRTQPHGVRAANLFHTENKGSRILLNFGTYLPNYMRLDSRTPQS
jgi:hypothetical protein